MYGRAAARQASPLIEQLELQPDLRELHRHAPDRYPFLLQSTAAESPLARFDILFACPGEAIVLEDNRLDGADSRPGFLDRLDRAWRREAINAPDTDLPFTGGWFVYLGYELAGEIEPTLTGGRDPLLPAAFAMRCTAALIHDRRKGSFFLVMEDGAATCRSQLMADIDEAARRPPGTHNAGHKLEVTEESGDGFVAAVQQALSHIADGDIYQANLSRAWTARGAGRLDVDSIYASLASSNPGPFAGIVRWGDTTIISSSPERLLQIRGREISTRPIAGTRPRSTDPVTDDSLSAELFAHPKEIAEHVMLIDLERNDLGRVCVAGSVEVDEMMVLESYAHVHHIVSNVRGTLRDDVTPGAAIRAVFPGGTITGCPKVRCMQIIQSLEARPRGAYTGSFGYLNRDGSLDLNILIRTMVARGNTVTFRAGSGIVADSDPAAELAETRAKAAGLLKALHNG